ncbi:CAP domain-containing protein [Flavobacterium sp. 5]|uniref:CAP domain-containing protein n=1 Tax=Flavobacterium sp. 5 TaxID=2035199 RepID=UPI000C2C5007|nr:CAP domain-containing protein [Flavobacterium sp. 5]PKB16616.1 uncharacterized protein YkwD [Flavobacterium sp. 5]
MKLYKAFFLFFLIVSCQNDIDDVIVDSDVTSTVLVEINKLRVTGCQCGEEYMPPVSPLVSNSILSKTAINQAHDMNVRNYFDHISPEGISPIQRAVYFGYTGTYVGEVIAKNYTNSVEVVAGWKNSPDHCKAMMDGIYIEMGAGKSGSIWVANFGK